MSRRLYTNTSGYRPVSDNEERSTRISSSSSVFTSRTPATFSSTSYKSTLDSSSNLSDRRSLLGREVDRARVRFDRECDDDDEFVEDTDIRLSPKPTIRKYGRTTHSQAFVTNPSKSTSVSTSVSTSSESNISSTVLSSNQRRIQEIEASKNEDIIIRGRTGDSIRETIVHERQPRKVEIKCEDTISQRTRHKLRTPGDSVIRKSEEVQEKDEKIRHESRLEAGWRTMTSFSTETHERSNIGGDSSGNDRHFRRLRRQQVQDDGKPPVASAASNSQVRSQLRAHDDNEGTNRDPAVRKTKSPAETEDENPSNNERARKSVHVMTTNASLETEVRRPEDNKEAAAGDVLVSETQASLETEVRRSNGRLQRRYGVKKKSETTVKELTSSTVKITVNEDNEDSGVNLEEPASSGADRWLGHGHSPVRNQWTEEDLDEFVRRLANPQHHVIKTASRDQPNQSGSRKSSIDGSKDRLNLRTLLGRLETDGSSSSVDREQNFTDRGKDSKNEDADRNTDGVSHGLSGLRLVKSKKLGRSSNSSDKLGLLSKSRESNQQRSLIHEDVHETADTVQDDSPVGLPAVCNSSPDSSEPEIYDDRKTLEQALSTAGTDGGKKRRFRKILSRPLIRAHSAGCAKDVPAHALFLNPQRKSDKDPEIVVPRKARLSEGDIRFPGQASFDEGVEDETLQNHLCVISSSRGLIGRIHKTKSADSAIMSTDDLVVTTQPKSKSRNIAKKISRKMLFLRRRHTDSTLGMMGNDDGARRLANVDPEEAKEWSKSFENLLFDKTGLELFRGFLLTEHSDENIEFWIACENYKTSKSNKQLPSLAMKIFTDYVAVQSLKEINLDSKTRTNTYESVTTNPTRQTFDEAQRRVQALMEKDSYRRFLESELYQDLASGNIQHKS